MNPSWNFNCVCKRNWYHIIYGFGVVFWKEYIGDVPVKFWTTHVTKVWPPDPESSVYLLASFQLQCIFEMMIISPFQVCFHVIFNHLSSKSALNILSYASGWFPTILAPSLCQIHRHYSVSGIGDYFSRCFIYVICICCLCHVDMLLTPK